MGASPRGNPRTSQGSASPKNFHSGKPYQGCNILLLGLAGYVSPYFLTYLQAQERGGHVRRGEKGYLVIKWGEYKKKTTDPANGAEAEESRGYLKGYTVFNACQIEGVEFPEVRAARVHPLRTGGKGRSDRCAHARSPGDPRGQRGRHLLR